MSEPFVRLIEPRGILSFAPDQEPIQLSPLNVVIGANGSGKSNLIEIFGILQAVPSDVTAVFRMGGGAAEWLWKGGRADSGTLRGLFSVPGVQGPLHYRIAFTPGDSRLEVVNETIEARGPKADPRAGLLLYALSAEQFVINVKEGEYRTERPIKPSTLDHHQSILAQRKDPERYPELTALAKELGRIQIFREWSFGLTSTLRHSQRADLPTDVLLPDLSNLGLVLSALERTDAWPRFEDYLRRFLPRFERLTIGVQGGSVQIFLRETGLSAPIPASRLSDGTLRFIALAAILLNPKPPSLVCIDEPELGLHPDALVLVAELLADGSDRAQVVVTTQSDVLVSALTDSVESVLVCENRNGASRFERIERGKLEHWLDKYRLGDLWRMGELGGNP